MPRRPPKNEEPAPESDPLSLRLLYSPHVPTPPQHAFMLLSDLEVLEAFYGGAGGGGKSDTLLMDALRYADVPGYSALILRKTFADLALPGAIMDRAKGWLAETDARWNESASRFRFPSGASLQFGYLQTQNDKYRYASAEFQFVAFDELTQFTEDDYRFLFTRLRRPKHGPLSQVPIRMRSASNPGGRGHEWVRRRLVHRLPAPVSEDQEPDPMDTPERAARRVFVPARLRDNPYLDADEYEEGLAALDPETRAQILDGDWDARPPGSWVYNHRHVAASLRLGDALDEELARGTIPPPAGELLVIGTDWGEHSHSLIGWPLEGGGLYVVAEATSLGVEPGEHTARVIGRRTNPRDPEGEKAVTGALDVVYALGSRPRKGGLHPPLPVVDDPLRLVSATYYDAAGIQSQRTYHKLAKARIGRHPIRKVAFGAPAAKSGQTTRTLSYKAETIGHLRKLTRRAGEGRTTGILAIGRRCPELRRQLPLLKWADQEAGLVEKGDDHGPDALIALDAHLAIKHRS